MFGGDKRIERGTERMDSGIDATDTLPERFLVAGSLRDVSGNGVLNLLRFFDHACHRFLNGWRLFHCLWQCLPRHSHTRNNNNQSNLTYISPFYFLINILVTLFSFPPHMDFIYFCGSPSFIFCLLLK